jgi:ADP-ribose pyrophosphatase YjhB (NUDIX family)
MYRQSAVIPYRRGPSGLEVLLVTSRKGTRWVLPKGVVEPDLSPAASAANEALEEAGVSGAIDAEPLGTDQYRKWGGICTVQVFAMEVEEEVADWPRGQHAQAGVADRRRRQAAGRRGRPGADLRSPHRGPVRASRRPGADGDGLGARPVLGRRHSATLWSRRTRCHANSTSAALLDEGSRA